MHTTQSTYEYKWRTRKAEQEPEIDNQNILMHKLMKPIYFGFFFRSFFLQFLSVSCFGSTLLKLCPGFRTAYQTHYLIIVRWCFIRFIVKK